MTVYIFIFVVCVVHPTIYFVKITLSVSLKIVSLEQFVSFIEFENAVHLFLDFIVLFAAKASMRCES